MSNRLSSSTSLYLRQHADNPVDWHPWDAEALDQARQAGLPILLSVGYSACHWCHVMAHESFEDPDCAAVMNELFVNIKVDREERPDLDRLYQLSHQLLTGRGGGWPLTVFLEPRELTPFFAGTYFPPTPRHGMPGFIDVLRRVRRWYDQRPDEVSDLNENLRRALRSVQETPVDPAPGEPFDAFVQQWRSRFDARHGGTLGAPKFPQAPLLASLAPVADQTGESDLLDQLDFSLRQMSRRGLRDHLDGGLFRYTVDEDWTIPHFEKMLYDNAQMLPLYAEAAARTGDPWLGEVAAGIAEWMSAELLQADGGFGASVDADAEGVEGGFHVWSKDELLAALDADQRTEVERVFGLDAAPNFEGHAWHLLRIAEADDTELLASALRRLAKVRAKRTPPTTDCKRLTAWNALAVEGLARAGLALDRADWISQALSTLDFLHGRMFEGNRLMAVHDGVRAACPAYLDDHAFLLRAILAVLRARWRGRDYDLALQLANRLLLDFDDPESGGFFFTAVGEEAPVTRLKLLQDDATPAGNGVAAEALLALGHLSGDIRYTQAAERVLQAATQVMQRYPLGHASLVRARQAWSAPPAQVVITGPDAEATLAWKAAVERADAVHCYAIPPEATNWPGPAGPAGDNTTTTATVCLGMRCLPPMHTLAALVSALDARN